MQISKKTYTLVMQGVPAAGGMSGSAFPPEASLPVEGRGVVKWIKSRALHEINKAL